MAYGMRLARKIVSQPPMAEWAGAELTPGPDAQTDDELIEYMHRTHNTVYHPACSCHMGPDSDPLAVVDPRLRVGGVRSLRIADGSILPFLPAINPCITTMMVGEKCADMLKEDARRGAEHAAPASGRIRSRTMSAAAAPEISRFLRCYLPSDASTTPMSSAWPGGEEEFHVAGATIFSQGAEPVEHLRVVRWGAVEIVLGGRMLDLLGEGELFGHASMLSGLPTGFEARAAEDTLCYRIPAEVAQGPLSRPAGLRFVARSLLELWAEGAGVLTADSRSIRRSSPCAP